MFDLVMPIVVFYFSRMGVGEGWGEIGQVRNGLQQCYNMWLSHLPK